VTVCERRIERRISASDRAGLVRIAFALAALSFADSVFPDEVSIWCVTIGYVLVALIFQLVIWRGWARGEPRSIAMGLIDIAFLTYPVFLLGPVTSVLPFGYLLIPVVNAASSSSRSRVALVLAGASSFTYATLLTIAGTGVLPYAPGIPGHRSTPPPSEQLLASGTMVLMSVLLTTLTVLRQMNALDRMNKQLSDLSQLDELTGLHNRRHLFSELRHQLDRVARGAHCCVMMIDLDGFKRVNDLLGHEAGDLLLTDIANALTTETRAVDLVARYGGDEFVVLLPDLASSRAAPVAERIVRAVEKVGACRWPTTPVTASVGVAMSRLDDDLGSLLRRADTQAYAAKRAGGNRTAMCCEEDAPMRARTSILDAASDGA
jgi:diguanylate cyclase (GGDEF)-like protein